MRYAHTVERVRAAEAALMARLPEGTLMQRAAAGIAATCAAALSDRRGGVYGSRVAVLAGGGDNGGDALYAAARLARRGAGVTAVLLAPGRAHPGGLAALRAAGGTAVDRGGEGLVEAADLVLDGITGIGGRGGLRPEALPYAAAAQRARERRGALVVAVDLPSGVDADTGEVHGAAVRADVTVCLGTHKPGLLVDPGAGYAGVVRLVDIGLGPELGEGRPGGRAACEALQHADAAALLPRPTGESDKYRRGVVGIAAGSARYPGAAVLATAGALHGGAGAVRYAGSAAEEVVRRFPEALVSAGGPAEAGRVQAWVVGPGLGDGPEAHRALDEALASDVPVLVDADGLTLLARRGPAALEGRRAPVLLTPHAGEAVRLLAAAHRPDPAAEVAAARLRHAVRIAEAYGAAVLLKGSTTVVVPAPAESARVHSAEYREWPVFPVAARTPVRVNPTGTPWLATAGSGDVLSGLAGSLLASGLDPVDAASCAAYLHGLAARTAAAGHAPGGRDAAGAPVSALDVAAALRAAWRSVRSAP
ncbi:NAD(P)H-hydrate epimerase [Streptacidiphilus sp. ASG 303]|uniref:NAD(P)H-hydrate epimerase n=1 Tax=Streptacidiphilus sp. ASG 303 TaxID=2896847 RepID=UPI001E409756|nr:NAD(P)H-hydrate epimerase [Streptacidiphilus sp. ASG 303]MCD0481952.1 NAD(P)H-hydrate epimerase [Streptacidiphilus sp. ASG 303]